MVKELKLTKSIEMKEIKTENESLDWRVGVDGEKIWMGKLKISQNERSNPQTHEDSEVAFYLLEGECKIFYGDNFENYNKLNGGDFIYIPPHSAYILETNNTETEFVVSMSPQFASKIVDQSYYSSKQKEEIQVIESNKLSDNTDQTSNMPRKTGVEADYLWIGRVTGEPAKDSGKHHHGEADTGGYIISGETRILYGENYENYHDFKAGDFVHVPPFIPHIERNLDEEIPVEFVTTRNPRNIVVNLED